jgi:hypothetical protein
MDGLNSSPVQDRPGVCSELSRVIQLGAEGFHDETEQRIRSSVRKKNPRKAYRILTKKRNWAS